jgi:hypothetical protein
VSHIACLETVDLDGLAIKPQALFLVRHEILHIFALISLQLDHLSHLGIGDDGAIAGELLLDHFEDLLLVEFLGQALDRGQGFATIALYKGLASALRDITRAEKAKGKDTLIQRDPRKAIQKRVRTLDPNVDVVLLTSLGLSTSVIGLRKGIEGLEVLDVRGHMIDWSVLLLLEEGGGGEVWGVEMLCVALGS